MSDTIMVKDYPFIKRLMPSYRKRKAILRRLETIVLNDLNWDGGSRSEYTLADLNTGQTVSVGDHMAAPWNNLDEGRKVELKPGQVMLQTGTFCGKTATMSITAHPETNLG